MTYKQFKENTLKDHKFAKGLTKLFCKHDWKRSNIQYTMARVDGVVVPVKSTELIFCKKCGIVREREL